MNSPKIRGEKVLVQKYDSGVAGRGRPSWDGGGRRTVKDDGRKTFFDSVRLKDESGRRTDNFLSQADRGGRRTGEFVRLKDGFGRRTDKFLFEADGGGRRTGISSASRTALT